MWWILGGLVALLGLAILARVLLEKIVEGLTDQDEG